MLPIYATAVAHKVIYTLFSAHAVSLYRPISSDRVTALENEFDDGKRYGSDQFCSTV